MSKEVHYTFSTYNRKHILVGEIATFLNELFEVICKEKCFKLVAKSVMVDHVHLLISKNDNDKNEYVMKMIKGISARRVFEKFNSNRLEFRKLWGRGYRAYMVQDEEALTRVVNYINSQKIDGIDKRAAKARKPRQIVPPRRDLIAGFQSQNQGGR